MAKYEVKIKGEFENILSKLEKEILESNTAISLVDKSDFHSENSKCSVRVFLLCATNRWKSCIFKSNLISK